MKRILVPYFHAGNGHLAFARAIQYHLKILRPLWEVRLFDAGKELPGDALQERFVEDWKRILAMPGIIKNTAFALEPLYGGLTKKQVLKTLKTAIPDVKALLQDWRPDAILPTHWGCSQLFAMARFELGLSPSLLPIWYIYSEFGRAYRLINCQADRYFTLTDEAAFDIERVGVHASQMVPVDLFLQPELENLPNQRESRLALDLDPDRFTVMFSLGGEGIGRVHEFLAACRSIFCPAQFVVICGRNKELVDKIRIAFPDIPGQSKIRPLGYQEHLATPLAACDIVAGKCGTSSAMETIMLRKPLIVCQPGALNEKDNKDYLIDHGYGWYYPQPKKFARFVAQLADPSSLWGRDRLAFCLHALKRHASKNGALEIAEYLTEHLTP